MNSQYDSQLNTIPADRHLVNELYAHNKLTREARDYSLSLISPANRWGAWIARMLLVTGSALVLCGIIYFFAFNWAKIPPTAKLAAIQIAMLVCLIGAFIYTLNTLAGKLLLLSTSVLTGVFMAVFGQIYQTGADAWQLFMWWSLFIFGWTLISCFAAQWLVWLVITNLFFVLWWQQAVMPERQMSHFVFAILLVFNGSALAIMEYVSDKHNAVWLHSRWMRIALIIAVVSTTLPPVLIWIMDFDSASSSVMLSALTGILGHVILFSLYRYKIHDIPALAIICLSLCIMLDAAALRLIAEIFDDIDVVMFLLMGLMTLAIFTGTVLFLRKTTAQLEQNNV